MAFKSEWIEKTRRCRTPEEYRQVLLEDVAHCVMEVAKGRAFFNVLEEAYSFINLEKDPALTKLRSYALEGRWSWTTENAMARDLAELVENMEAVKQRGDTVLLGYHAALHELVSEKLHMDRGAAVLEAFDAAGASEKVKMFRELREATLKGWAEGQKRMKQESVDLGADPLIRYKAVASAELERKRFVRSAVSEAD